MTVLQVMEYLDKLEGLQKSIVSLSEPDSISQVAKRKLRAMMAACSPEQRQSKGDTGAAHTYVLLGMLRLALCTSAAHDAAELIVDLYPAIGPALGVKLPNIKSGDVGADDSMNGEDSAEDAQEDGIGWINQLTECLLSLLSDSLDSVPMAVMRVASEGLWRSAASHVNAIALSDLLQVLLRLDQKAVAEEAMFEGEDESDDEDDEDEEDDGGEEEDKEEDSGDEDGVETGGNGKVPLDGAADKAQDSEEDSEDDGLDDTAMFRLDKQLAKYFSTLKGNKEVISFRNFATGPNFVSERR